MKNLINTLIFLFGIFWFVPEAFSATPPLSSDELEHMANTIVIGKVRNIIATGRTEESNCWKKTEKVAWVKVKEYLKHAGSTDKELNIHFWDYAFKEGCVGPSDHRHFIGEMAKYFLSCRYVTECRLVHWSGVMPQE